MPCQMSRRLQVWQQVRTYASAAPHRPSRFDASVSLDHFLQRGRAMSLWRQILRSTRRIADENTRRDVKQLAREEFNRNRAVTDIVQIRYLISTGKTQWESTERYIDGL